MTCQLVEWFSLVTWPSGQMIRIGLPSLRAYRMVDHVPDLTSSGPFGIVTNASVQSTIALLRTRYGLSSKVMSPATRARRAGFSGGWRAIFAPVPAKTILTSR